MPDRPRVLLVDLNNFARYPTLPIGYLAAVLRREGHPVSVFAPLMLGVRGVSREARPHRLSLAIAKLNYRVATSANPAIRGARDWLAARRRSEIELRRSAVIRGFETELRRARPDAVMISTYLMYKDVCSALCAICAQAGVPVIVGGPYFAQIDVLNEWVRIPGLTALAAGEVELQSPAIVNALVKREDLSAFPGLFSLDADGNARGTIAPPSQDLDAVPFPDYSDFPWSRYPNRMVPISTGRGCGWGVCTFCSDVTSTAGRSFRSRNPDAVLAEIANHHTHSQTSLFAFTDLKLNSNLEMWRAIAARMQDAAPGAQWIASVHAGVHGEAGLSRAELQAAADSGCVRLTTGLETGSQRIADLMRKGTRLESISRFLRDAGAAGISCRCTMILGYPGETAEDLDMSTAFLADHCDVIERVSLSRLQVIAGTPLHAMVRRSPERLPGLSVLDGDPAQALVAHFHEEARKPAYREAALSLLTAVHRINAGELSLRARAFEGAM